MTIHLRIETTASTSMAAIIRRREGYHTGARTEIRRASLYAVGGFPPPTNFAGPSSVLEAVQEFLSFAIDVVRDAVVQAAMTDDRRREDVIPELVLCDQLKGLG